MSHQPEVHTQPSRKALGLRGLYAVPERRVPRAGFVPAGRSLHLVDVENLMGGPTRGDLVLRRTLAEYREAATVRPGDHVIIGANPQVGIVAKASWPGARLVVRRGADGADFALLECVQDVDFIAARYDRIVVGSGDAAFDLVATQYRGCGLAVGVVARRGSLSYVLGRSASFVQLLPDVDGLRTSV